MAKKQAKKVGKSQAEKATRAVRLDLPIEVYERLERCAKRVGLNKSSFVRMAVIERIEEDERKGQK